MDEDSDQESLGASLRSARKKAGFSSIRKFALEVGTDHTIISRIENGQVTHPAAELLQRIADVAHIDIAKLLPYIGVRLTLPKPKEYLRKAYGITDEEAAEMVALIEARHG